MRVERTPLRPLIVVLLALGPVSAQAASDGIPTVIAARMKQDKKDCDAPASFEKGFITIKDVNGDRVPDYILDYGHFVCGGSHSFYCGSGGCTMAVYASSDGKFVKALDDLVQGIRFANIKGRPAALLGLHGSACGKVGTAPCGETLYWNGSEFSPAH